MEQLLTSSHGTDGGGGGSIVHTPSPSLPLSNSQFHIYLLTFRHVNGCFKGMEDYEVMIGFEIVVTFQNNKNNEVELILKCILKNYILSRGKHP